MNLRRPSHGVFVVLAIGLGFVAVGVGGYLVWQRDDRLPTQDSATYLETTRSFYRGLASLQVGLLDNAVAEFTRATELVPPPCSF